MHRRYITPTPDETGLNGRRCNVAVTLVIGLSNSRPDAVHQIVVAFLAVMETPIGLSEGVGFLPSGHQITLRGESRNNGPNFTASDEVASWFSVHGNYSL